MEKEKLKILSYKSGVSSLPTYPSDEGYNADELKAAFDARSNNEIKEKHNALVDAVVSETESLSAKDSELEGKTKALQSSIEERAKQLQNSIEERASALQGSIEESANGLQGLISDLAEVEADHENNKNNPHGVTLEQLGFEEPDTKIKRVSSDDELSEIIPEEGEIYVIEYKNLPYEDSEGNTVTGEKSVYLLKIGNGINSLKDLPPMQNTVPGEGEGSFSQFLEDEAKEYISGEKYKYPRAVALGYGSIALGRFNKASGENSMVVNYRNEVRAKNAFAANAENFIPENAEGAFAAGHGNVATNKYQTILGTYADIKEDDLFAIGCGGSEWNKRSGLRVNKQGKVYCDFELISENSFVNNGSAVFNGDATYNKDMINKGYVRLGNFNFSPETSYGEWSYAYGLGSAAFGRNNKVYGKYSFATLSSNTIPEKTADGKYDIESVFVAGHGNTATEPHQAIFGTYSAPATNDAFVVGNGTSAKKKNAFAVNKDGSIRIGGKQMTLGSTIITEENIKALLKLVTPEEESV